MPEYLEDLRAALVTVINATWDDLTAINHPQEMARIPWEQCAFPLCVLDLDPVPSPEWGIGNRADLVTVTINRVIRDSESRGALLENLEALRTALWPDNGTEPLAAGQVLDYPAVTDTMNLPVNQYFLAAGRPYYAGAVVAKILIGETP